MASFHDYMAEYKKQMAKGYLPAAYQGLMQYIMDLRTYFKNKYPGALTSGSLYYGYMDMTYFPLFTESLKSRQLKIAVVFIHQSVCFEAWLAGNNKQIQTQYWELFQASNWHKYRMPLDPTGADSIIECTLADDPDFSNLDALTGQIEKGTLAFIKDIEDFLAQH